MEDIIIRILAWGVVIVVALVFFFSIAESVETFQRLYGKEREPEPTPEPTPEPKARRTAPFMDKPTTPEPAPKPKPARPTFSEPWAHQCFGDKWLDYETAKAAYEESKAEAESIVRSGKDKERWQECLEMRLAHVRLAVNKYANEAERKVDLEKMAAYFLHFVEWKKEYWEEAKAKYEEAKESSLNDLLWSVYNLKVGYEKGIRDRARWQEIGRAHV